jgi:hypothetical protein
MAKFDRIVIAGGPKAGKTTLSGLLGRPVLHSDDLIGYYSWSGVSEELARRMVPDERWVMEGVATVRALRKWMSLNPGQKLPVDLVILMTEPLVDITPRQFGMLKAVLTIWEEIRDATEVYAKVVTGIDLREIAERS